MTTASLVPPLEAPLDTDGLFQKLLNRLQFAKAAEEWSRCVSNLSSWEREHLLVDHPTAERLTEHRKILDQLILFGQLCAFVASYPDFDNFETAEMIHATQIVLKDKLRMWHAPRMSKEPAEQILKEVFPEPGSLSACSMRV